MRALTRAHGIAALVLACVAAAAPARAQVPAADAFEVVRSRNFDYQFWPHVAASARGEFIVVWNWEHRFAPILDREVMARRYTASGFPRGSAYQVNVWTTGNQLVRGRPGVSPVRDRDFVVTWEEYWTGGSRGRILGSTAPRGNEFGLGLRADAVAGAADGHFVVVGLVQGPDFLYDVKARLFDARGTPPRPSFLVNTYTTGAQWAPAVASRSDGAFVVAWAGGDGDGTGVFAQRFAADGTRQGGEFRVHDGTAGYQGLPSVAMDEDGGFAVAWEHDTPDEHGLFVRRFDSSGTPLSAPVLVDVTNVTDTFPSVATDASGNVVVTWQRGTFSGGSGVWGRRFRADGTPRGAPFEVAPIQLWAELPSVASDPQGNFVVSWGLLANRYFLVPDRVLARRYGGLRPAALEVDAAGSPTANGNGVLEACETVSVRPAWINLTTSAQALAGDLTSFKGPAGATYSVVDAAGTYGSIVAGSSGLCQDCYAAGVSCASSRPATHWDATLTEQLRPDEQGQTMRWPLHLGDSFADVPRTSPFYRSVETLLHRGVTAGCDEGRFCGADSVTRAQMAVFVLLSSEGPAYRPVNCGSPVFADVPPSSPFCPYVEELARRGVVGGCGGGNYCPSEPVTRGQMAVFVMRTALPEVDPPACGLPRFSDVSAGDPFCRFIEELARRGVVAGCGGGHYCPADPITREQAAVFLAAGFALTLYGP